MALFQIGRALVSTHDYRRAVEYYRKALRGQPTSVPLRHDLAKLCVKLGRFDDASGVLAEVWHVCTPVSTLDAVLDGFLNASKTLARTISNESVDAMIKSEAARQ